METSLSEYIGMAILFVAILLMTAQTAFAFGRKVGGNTERLLADRRVQGVLDYENKRRPKARKNKLKASRKSRVGSISVCV
jgi:hypothetical protein